MINLTSPKIYAGGKMVKATSALKGGIPKMVECLSRLGRKNGKMLHWKYRKFTQMEIRLAESDRRESVKVKRRI